MSAPIATMDANEPSRGALETSVHELPLVVSQSAPSHAIGVLPSPLADPSSPLWPDESSPASTPMPLSPFVPASPKVCAAPELAKVRKTARNAMWMNEKCMARAPSTALANGPSQ
jgi:hypothetical protein